jgi:hypothetical protein
MALARFDMRAAGYALGAALINAAQQMQPHNLACGQGSGWRSRADDFLTEVHNLVDDLEKDLKK